MSTFFIIVRLQNVVFTRNVNAEQWASKEPLNILSSTHLEDSIRLKVAFSNNDTVLCKEACSNLVEKRNELRSHAKLSLHSVSDAFLYRKSPFQLRIAH
jgi:hypothetical protein